MSPSSGAPDGPQQQHQPPQQQQQHAGPRRAAAQVAKPHWSSGTFVRTTLPMFGFVVLAWWGLSQLMESKLAIRHGARGYDKVEEYDPIERAKRLAAASAGGSGSTSSSAAAAAAAGGSSKEELEAELRALTSQVDIHDFSYKPVPRTDGDDEE